MHFFPFYHWLSKKLTQIPQDSELWPPSWKTVEIKAYDGALTFRLQNDYAHLFRETDVRELLLSRASYRDFTGKERVDGHALSALLAFSCGTSKRGADESPRRVYPSGGALYPIEVYVSSRHNIGEIPSGLYHYRSDIHSLETVRRYGDKDSGGDSFFTYEWANRAPVAIFLTALFDRSVKKYSERGYRYALLEAGHIAQNGFLIATAMGLHLASLGGVHDALVEEHLGIDGVSESLVYSLVVG